MASLHSTPVTACPLGHDLGPGRFRVSWLPCSCTPAIEGNRGHLTVTCNACSREGIRAVRYEPPHTRGHQERIGPPPPCP